MLYCRCKSNASFGLLKDRSLCCSLQVCKHGKQCKSNATQFCHGERWLRWALHDGRNVYWIHLNTLPGFAGQTSLSHCSDVCQGTGLHFWHSSWRLYSCSSTVSEVAICSFDLRDCWTVAGIPGIAGFSKVWPGPHLSFDGNSAPVTRTPHANTTTLVAAACCCHPCRYW